MPRSRAVEPTLPPEIAGLPEEAQDLWRLYQEHGTQRGVAAVLGVSERTVRYAWTRYGLPPCPRGRRPALAAALRRVRPVRNSCSK